MTDFLERLASRIMNTDPVLRPRAPALFEPAPRLPGQPFPILDGEVDIEVDAGAPPSIGGQSPYPYPPGPGEDIVGRPGVRSGDPSAPGAPASGQDGDPRQRGGGPAADGVEPYPASASGRRRPTDVAVPPDRPAAAEPDRSGTPEVPAGAPRASARSVDQWAAPAEAGGAAPARGTRHATPVRDGARPAASRATAGFAATAPDHRHEPARATADRAHPGGPDASAGSASPAAPVRPGKRDDIGGPPADEPTAAPGAVELATTDPVEVRSPSAAAVRSAAAASAGRTDVYVSIGRVEVRAVDNEPVAVPGAGQRRTDGLMSLADYIRHRTAGGYR